jgi:predicted transcriptional regulator
VAEWFPVRALAIEAALVVNESVELDSVVALALAESLRVPLVTKNADIESSLITVLHC